MGKIDLQEHFPDVYETVPPHNFDLPGRYKLSARYVVEDLEGAPVDLYPGPLEAKPIEFEVRPLEGDLLATLINQLGDPDPKKRAEAMNLIRRGKAVDHVPDLLAYLNVDHPPDLRRETAKAVYQFPDLADRDTCVRFLLDAHPKVRGYMALTLIKIGDPAACDALYEATDPIKYPESHLPALKALHKLGDPRAVEVARSLDHDGTGRFIRDFAKKIIRESENQ